jgi:hypothetical protein
MSLRLAAPESAIMASFPLPSDTKPIVVGAGNLKFKLIYGAIVCVGVLGFVAYHNVGFVEKYFPSLNAQLHKGEITDESDAEYAGYQIYKDAEALNQDTKAKGWTAVRAEYLTRKPFLEDLVTQNGRLQLAITKESAAGKQEPCEQLAINQYMPAVDDYTKTMNRFFEVLEATKSLTKQTVETISELAAQQDDAINRMSKYVADRKSKGCDK